ncbi:uncharacterized protein C3orf18 homolog [Poecilia reticulata]|uniref:uncharacterized protein C3orf18 homolog n=1 Tax=Poecilia reticulata TaxID=8081 RepID=UPI0004A3F655|nr:PREDICTED: uncharacterized protein C3orf18 homolog [Poecilia reticulata]
MAVNTAKTASSFLSTTATTATGPLLSTSLGPRENITSRTFMTVTLTTAATTNESSFNATAAPNVVIEGSSVGMLLVPFGIITLIGLAVAIMLYIRKRKR